MVATKTRGFLTTGKGMSNWYLQYRYRTYSAARIWKMLSTLKEHAYRQFWAWIAVPNFMGLLISTSGLGRWKIIGENYRVEAWGSMSYDFLTVILLREHQGAVQMN